MMYSVFVSCAKGLEYLLSDELMALGVVPSRISPQGVFADVSLETLYRVALWSRIASRVHVILFSGVASDQKSLYALCRAHPWDQVFSAQKTMAVVFHGESPNFRHSLFGAQVVKDAVVDFFRETSGQRPHVERVAPDVLLHAHLKHDTVTLSLDFTGLSLHQRGYRLEAGLAPLKETVAAAMLLRADWPHLAELGLAFHDPCCGSGTLVIEAALMAAQVAPGSLRDDHAFIHWLEHSPSLWASVQQDARTKVREPGCVLLGSDSDARVLAHARANAQRAGVSAWVEWREMALLDAKPSAPAGLLASNPPYGVRLGEEAEWLDFYKQLGQVMHAQYQGWQGAILTPSAALAKAIGLRSHKQYTVYNAKLACKIYLFELNSANTWRHAAPVRVSDEAQMFVNRLKKNHAHLSKWAKRHQVDCYRVYDADLPEYAFALDMYADYVVLQEYMAPASIDVKKAEKRRMDVIHALPEALGVPPSHVMMKQRQPQKGRQQYEKLQQTQLKLVVREGDAKFQLNLSDYLDTGLFLDHRPLRLKFAELAPGMRFLNCFCYTATASVHAALAGAFTVNVDLSNTYLAWALENFNLNQIDTSRHQFVHYDCLQWLQLTQDRFDVIFLDPPSFSNSKRMQTTLDVQRDHDTLIAAAMALLKPAGVLYFSTNLRSFKLSAQLMATYQVEDITTSTIDVDFKRNPRIHQCFRLGVKEG